MFPQSLLTYLINSLKGPFPVYTSAPDVASYPYMTLQITSIERPFSMETKPSKYKVHLTLRAVSRSKDTMEIQSMSQHVHDILCDRLLIIDKLGKACCQIINEETQVLNDRSTYFTTTRLIMRIRP